MFVKIPVIPVYSLLTSGLFLHDQHGRLVGAKTVQLGDETIITGALSAGSQFNILKSSALEEAIIADMTSTSPTRDPEIYISAIWVLMQHENTAQKFVRVAITEDQNLIEIGETNDGLEIQIFMDLAAFTKLPGLIDFTLIVDMVSGYLSPRYNPSKTIVQGYELTAFIKK